MKINKNKNEVPRVKDVFSPFRLSQEVLSKKKKLKTTRVLSLLYPLIDSRKSVAEVAVCSTAAKTVCYAFQSLIVHIRRVAQTPK